MLTVLAVFLVPLAVGIGMEIYAARTGRFAGLRRNLERALALLTRYPARLVHWHRRRREKSYEADWPQDRSALGKWAIRAHIFLLIPVATYFAGEAMAALARDHKPIGGMYLTPSEAWYFGAFGGLVFSALAPLVAYMAFRLFIVVPFNVIEFANRFLARKLAPDTGEPAGIPFVATAAIVGLAAAALLLLKDV